MIKPIMKKTITLLFIAFIAGVPCLAQGIFRAVDEGNPERIKTILSKDKNQIHRRDSRLNTPLHIAVAKGDKNIVELLIKYGADVNAKDDMGRTPLHRSITPFGADLEILDLLLKNNADPNLLDNRKEPPIALAVDGQKLDIVKKFIEAGYDINLKLSADSTLLHFAAERGHIGIMDYLISKGADVNAKNVYQITPLHVAAVYGNTEAVKLLIEKGADINAKSRTAGSPLHLAQAAGYPDVADLLIKKGGENIRPDLPVMEGNYLGLTPPGSSPELFAPELLQNVFRWAKPPLFSADGREMYWSGSAPHGNGSKIWTMKQENGRWTTPRAVSFSGKFKDQLVCLSMDGRRLFFNSRRPLQEGGQLKDADLWFVTKTGNGWSLPVNCGPPVNTSGHEMRGSIAASGTLYVDSDQYQESSGGLDIYRTEALDSSFSGPVNLRPAVNSRYLDAYPAVSPDENYLIFSSNRPGGYGIFDLYISFREPDGSWSGVKNMGKSINSGFRLWPKISTDGRYLFFVTDWQIYWMDIRKVIKELRELPYTDVKSAMSKAISEKGVAEALRLYRELKDTYPDYYPCPEITLNTLGYQLLGKGQIREAVAVLKLGTIEFPDSWNAFDSYAEALMKAGMYEDAAVNYKKSLKLDPGNDNAEEMLKRLEVKIKDAPGG
jgi:hypothetical protein